jgi:hypothetical protein
MALFMYPYYMRRECHDVTAVTKSNFLVAGKCRGNGISHQVYLKGWGGGMGRPESLSDI